MTDYTAFVDAAGYGLWGLLFGYALSAPVGPVNIIVLQRALFGRARDGFLIGLGAAVGDAFYAGLAAFGLNYVHAMLEAHSTSLRLVGGTLMAVFAVRIWRAHPHLERTDVTGKIKRSMTATLVLTLSNPGVFLGFLAFFSAAGLSDLGARGRGAGVDGAVLMGGVFVGASLWWATLAAGGVYLRDRITDQLLLRLNRGSAVLIGLFAIGAVFSVFLTDRMPV